MAEAMTETMSKLRKSVECVICQDQMHRPKNLLCSHSFCKDCLDEMIIFDDDGSGSIQCPFNCEPKVTIKANETSNSLKNNYSFQNVLDIIGDDIDNDGKCQFLEDCKNSALKSCSKCSKKVCTTCSKEHNCKAIYVDIAFDPKCKTFIPYCQEHEAYAKYICFSCDEKFICIYCCNRDHKLHNKESILKYAPATKTGMISQFELATEFFAKTPIFYQDEMLKFQPMKENLMIELKERTLKRVCHYIASLNKQADDIMQEYDEKVMEYKKKLEDDKLLIEDIQYGLRTHIKNVMQKQDFEILSEQKEIIQQLDRLTSIHFFSTNLPEYDNNINTLEELDLKLHTANYDKTNNQNIIQENIHQAYQDREYIEIDLQYLKRYIDDQYAFLQGRNEKRKGNTRTTESSQCDEQQYSFNGINSHIINNNLEGFSTLIRDQPDIINRKNSVNETFLHTATSAGYHDIVKLLLEIDATHVNDQTVGGVTPLMEASRNGHPICQDLLLQYGAEVNMANDDGNTALMYAVTYGVTTCVGFLLKKGARIDAKSKNGNTALIRAALGGYVECLKVLLQYQPLIDATNNEGVSALMYAASNCHESCVAVLLQHNADMSIKNHEGNTAYKLAKSGKIRSMLQERMPRKKLSLKDFLRN